MSDNQCLSAIYLKLVTLIQFIGCLHLSYSAHAVMMVVWGDMFAIQRGHCFELCAISGGCFHDTFANNTLVKNNFQNIAEYLQNG